MIIFAYIDVWDFGAQQLDRYHLLATGCDFGDTYHPSSCILRQMYKNEETVFDSSIYT